MCGINNGCCMPSYGRIYEFYAAMLGQVLLTPTIEPAIINFPEDILEWLPYSESQAVAGGENRHFGSKFLGSGWEVYMPGKMLEKNILDDAIAIYIFDLIIQNMDRKPENPNLFVNGYSLVALDHELAFTFTRNSSYNSPWDVYGMQFTTDHVLYKSLKGKKDLVAQHIHNITKPGMESIEYIPKIIPAAWSNNYVKIITDHLESLFNHMNRFEASVMEVLK